MKNSAIKFATFFFVIGILLGGSLILYGYYQKGNDIREELAKEIIDITESKSSQIEDYLSEVKEDVSILAESDKVKEALKSKLVSDENAAKDNVLQVSKIIAKEVENYILAHPEMSLEDLQNSKEFQNIMVQPVGKTGYSAAHGTYNLEIYFHKYPEYLGRNLEEFKSQSPKLLEYLEELKSGVKSSEGFYNWEDPDGITRQKYGLFTRIPANTSDGKSISLAVTAYIENYKIFENVPSDAQSYLKDFAKKTGYSNLILITADGYKAYSTKKEGYLGTNLEWTAAEEGISRNYEKVKESYQTEFYGPFIRPFGDIYPQISVMTPIYDGETFLGFLALTNDMNKISKIAEGTGEFEKKEESYLINNEELLLTPLKDRNLEILVQSINTENAEECIKDYQEAEKTTGDVLEMEAAEKKNFKLNEFLNYKGEKTFGTDMQIPDLEWCLLVEFDKDETLDAPLRDYIIPWFIIIFILILLISFGGYLLGERLGRK